VVRFASCGVAIDSCSRGVQTFTQDRPQMSKDKLTPKQEAFVAAFLETRDAVLAYKSAYDASGMSTASIGKEAKRLLDHPLVHPQITPKPARLSEMAVATALLTLEEHMEELKSIRDLAKREGKYQAAVAAEVKRGELRKFYIKQVEHGEVGDFSRLSDDELNAELQAVGKELFGKPDKRATKH
jgi:phage terminase small subunit